MTSDFWLAATYRPIKKERGRAISAKPKMPHSEHQIYARESEVFGRRGGPP